MVCCPTILKNGFICGLFLKPKLTKVRENWSKILIIDPISKTEVLKRASVFLSFFRLNANAIEKILSQNSCNLYIFFYVMTNKPYVISIVLIINLIQLTYAQSHLRLWYRQPASIWEASLPLGNGRLGAMPDGGILEENIVLNDITLWSGGPQDADDPEAIKYLPKIRQLLFEGKNDEAEALMYETFVSKGPGSGQGQGADVPYGSYQVLGNLHLRFDYGVNSSQMQLTQYQRELSLDSAIARSSYTINGVNYTREYFTSFADDVIMIRLSADHPGKLNLTVGLDRPERYHTTVEGEELVMRGQLNNGTGGRGMRYITKVWLKPEGGKLVAGDSTLQLQQANSVILYVSATTDYQEAEFEEKASHLLENALQRSYATQKEDHIRAFQSLFHGVHLELGMNPTADTLPTDERLKAFAKNPDDPGLAALYFQYGRYLLISSTRPGLLPPNLQGLWANTIQTPWNGDYHLDINIQMNHWPLNVTNLPMLNDPFYQLVKSLVEPGEKTARVYYQGDGWVAHVITNIWGYTSPGEHPSWGATNSGSGWLCHMLWRHYAFTLDTAYLQKIYPILKGSAEFYLSTMVEYPKHGWLVTAPSNSPENAFRLPNGKTAHVVIGPTVDNQIIRALFSHVINASQMLDVDQGLREELEKAKAKLPPNQIGEDGRLMEWLQEYEEADPHHRHVSHLWGLHPGNEITPARTPELAQAAEATLEKRGDKSTGWSLAWKINFWARLGDGDRAFKLLQSLLEPTVYQGFNMTDGGGTYPNLFCAHPPFQIDGNFGGTAGIAEMLVQSHAGYIQFLPALPAQWKGGYYEGLCVRGGGVVSAKWENSKLQQASLQANVSNIFDIQVPDNAKSVEINIDQVSNKKIVQDGFIEIKLKKGQVATFSFIY